MTIWILTKKVEGSRANREPFLETFSLHIPDQKN